MKHNLSKMFAITALSLALGACGTFGSSNDDDVKSASADFAKQNGKVHIVFDSKGNWQSVSATASGPIVGTFYAAEEQAGTIAAMRAKRNIAEFLSTDLSSTKSLIVVSKTIQKAKETKTAETGDQPVSLNSDELSSIEQELKGNGKQTNLDSSATVVANTVREQISESANAILKGVQISKITVSPDGKFVQVEVQIVKKHISAAKRIKLDMQ
jgi:predicted small lipoprotein YifL